MSRLSGEPCTRPTLTVDDGGAGRVVSIVDRLPAKPSRFAARKALVDELHAARREFNRRKDAANEIRLVRAEIALDEHDGPEAA